MKNIKESHRLPFWGNIEQYKRIEDTIEGCLKVIRDSDSIRQIVLESWLTVDLVVREFLISGFELARYDNPDFDVRYQLLPQSFENLLTLLENTVKHQKKSGRRFEDIAIPIPANLLVLLSNEEQEMLNSVLFRYYKKEYPKEWKEFTRRSDPSFLLDTTKHGMADGWIDIAQKLDDKWFCLARRLQKARNKAAHSYNVDTISKAFGIVGKNQLKYVKKECFNLLNKLIGTNST